MKNFKSAIKKTGPGCCRVSLSWVSSVLSSPATYENHHVPAYTYVGTYFLKLSRLIKMKVRTKKLHTFFVHFTQPFPLLQTKNISSRKICMGFANCFTDGTVCSHKIQGDPALTTLHHKTPSWCTVWARYPKQPNYQGCLTPKWGLCMISKTTHSILLYGGLGLSVRVRDLTLTLIYYKRFREYSDFFFWEVLQCADCPAYSEC